MALDKQLSDAPPPPDKAIAKFQPLSLEDAVATVSAPLCLPDFAEKFFGKAHIDTLRGLLGNQIIKDVDVLYLTGDISETEGIEYALVLEEVRELFIKLRDLTAVMAAAVKPKLMHYMGDLVKIRRNGEIKINTNGLHKFLNGTSSFSIAIDNSRSQRVVIFDVGYAYFLIELERALCRETYDVLLEKYPDPIVREAIVCRLFAEQAPDPILESGQSSYAVYLLALHRYRTSFKDHACHFAQLFTLPPQQPGETGDADILREIRELSMFRTIDFSAHVDGCTIKFAPMVKYDEEDSHFQRPFSICIAMIEADSAEKDKPGARLAGMINRLTGDFDIGSGEDLANLTNKDTALHVKRVLYRLILDHLRNMPEDIARSAPTLKPQKIAEETRDAAEQVVADDTEIAAETETETVIVAEEVEIPTPESPRCAVAKPTATIANLRGVPGSRIKGALDILLGPPLRVSGSHHVYRTRQGGTYPIPLHGTDEVGTGILNKCLREFGITPAELRGCL